MKLPKLKKLNAKGLSHHVIIALVVVLGVAGFGAYRVFSSSAATANGNTKAGCNALGRVWQNKSCTRTCITAGHVITNKSGNKWDNCYKPAPKQNTGTPAPSGSSNAAESATRASCVINAPNKIKVGATYSPSVTVKNTGTRTITPKINYSAGATGRGVSTTATLSSIAPGKSVTKSLGDWSIGDPKHGDAGASASGINVQFSCAKNTRVVR